MKKQEILRVARLVCIPNKGDDNDDDSNRAIDNNEDWKISTVCSLWSGMGHIYKVTTTATDGDSSFSFILKHVAPPRSSRNPSFGDQRKADSYQVEANFYEKLAKRLIQEHGLGLPQPYLVERNSGKGQNEIVIATSFVESNSQFSLDDDDDDTNMKAVLTWLATLHASYWGNEQVDQVVETVGLQPIGSYWHLETRPEEHESMNRRGWEGRLKRAARAIDDRLRRDPMQCLIHGDAKEANVLISTSTTATASNKDGKVVSVAMCDFQYCGKGPPTRDLSYFFCSSLNPEDEDAALEFYLHELIQRLPANEDAVTPSPTLDALKDSLELAYADFYRFMAGWGYWGSLSGGEARVKALLDRLDHGKDLGSEEAYRQAVYREYG